MHILAVIILIAVAYLVLGIGTFTLCVALEGKDEFPTDSFWIVVGLWWVLLVIVVGLRLQAVGERLAGLIHKSFDKK